jgi:uncharacterized protein involved in exopolysaccharide biosynthesis/Mrp family chromosome partitioning ATPase
MDWSSMDKYLPVSWRPIVDRDRARSSEFIALQDVQSFARIHKATIVFGVLLGLGLGWAYGATSPLAFRTRTEILIDPRLPQLPQQSSEVNLSLDTAQIESQIAVLRSEKIASMVIEQLDLMHNAEFIASGSPTLRRRLVDLIDMLPQPAWSRVEPIRAALAEEDPIAAFTALPDDQRLRIAIEKLNAATDVRRVGVSYALEISARSSNPVLAAEMANAAAESYVREQLDTRAATAKEGVAWLEQRLAELRRQMNRATEAAQEFRARHDYSVMPLRDQQQRGMNEYLEPTLEELETTAETYRKMYESFLAAFTNSVSQQSYQVADARVITKAMAPLIPSEPRRKLILVFGAFAGLAVGLGIAFLRWTLDGSVRSGQGIRDEFDLDCIAELPPVGRRRRGHPPLDEVHRHPRATYAENIRILRASISLYEAIRPVRSIGFVSAHSSDGKSTTAANLCHSYRQSGLRVLLVDADIYSSVLTQNLVLSSSIHTAAAADTLQQLVVQVGEDGLDLLPSSVAGFRQLLTQRGMASGLAELSAYDVIVVDLPSLESGQEKFAAAAALDAVVVVAEWGVTPLEQVGRVVRSLHAHKASIVGVALTNNRVPSSTFRRRRRMWSAT